MRIYSLKEIEEKFGISTRKLLFLIRRGHLRAFIKNEKIYVKKPDLLKYLQSSKKIRRKQHFSYLKSLGPGVITGAADDDCSGVVTYTQVGAQQGLALSWMAVYLVPMMAAVQESSARIGIVTQKGLVNVLKKYYSKRLLYFLVFLLVIANTINIGADIGAMAAALNLVSGINYFWAALALTIFIIILEVGFSYKRYARYLKFLTLSLFAYVITGFIVNFDFGEVLRSIVLPKFSFNKDFLAAIVAVMGTTISPYLFFWQASEEVEEGREKGMSKKEKKFIISRELREMRKDTILGMVIANIVFLFIVIVAASVLYRSGIRDINSAHDAALALRPLAGDLAYFVFTFGIIGVGLLAVPILAGSSAYAVSEAIGWEEGLSKKYFQARGFYLVIILSMLVGFIFNFVGINPMKALYYTAILNGIVSPIIMFFIFKIGNNRKVMGDFTNPRWVNFWGGLATLLMGLAAIFLIVSFFFE